MIWLLAACGAPHVCWEQQIRGGPLPAPLPEGLSCEAGASCDRWERRAYALARAGAFLAAQRYPRYDGAIGASAVTALVTDSAWRQVLSQTLEQAARDPDHPSRRLFEPDFRVAPGVTTSWTAPAAGERIPYNRVVGEALHCPEHGWRPQTEAYACGAMRDRSYGTTHALWALQLARQAGCTEAACARELAVELQGLLADPWPSTLEAVDLRAEAAVMLLREGEPATEAIERLLALQSPDGGWGAPGDDPVLRGHATLLAAWALALESRGP